AVPDRIPDSLRHGSDAFGDAARLAPASTASLAFVDQQEVHVAAGRTLPPTQPAHSDQREATPKATSDHCGWSRLVRCRRRTFAAPRVAWLDRRCEEFAEPAVQCR